MDNHEVDTSKMFFLLGGHDLEMLTIRDVLKAQGVAYIDHNLRWDNALLGSYSEEITKAESEGKDIYGIELREDVPLPHGYHVVDHHNELSQLPSSLEQVMETLHLPMNRHQVLVAENDKAYIPGMLKMGATEEEISTIRQADRRAQGVTEEDERLATNDIARGMTMTGDLIAVKATCNHFSLICDKLYPYKQLLIYNDHEWTFYGEGADGVYRAFSSSSVDKGIKKYLYRGGGSHGYVGVESGKCTKEQITKMTERIKEMFPYSYHVFYFPFKWILKGTEDKVFSDQINLEKVTEVTKKDGQWERILYDPKGNQAMDAEEQKEMFAEMQYYFEFVHDVLYDKVKTDNKQIILHYEREEPKNDNVTYNIQVGDKPYELKVDSMNLNIYSTGVGILSIFLKNLRKEQSDENSIRDINQYGRRIMPPHAGELDPEHRSLLPKSISIKGLKDEDKYSDTFNDNDLTKTWQPSKFITNLIDDLATEIEATPLIDDRMLVNCWYGNDEISKRLSNLDAEGLAKDEFWYKFLFVDEGKDASCQNKKMKAELIANSTYKRWQGYGSLYGVTRYSMMFLTNSGGYGLVGTHSRTIYSRLFELIIIQRASVLRFSKEVTEVSNLSLKGGENKELVDRIESLYKEYIRFVNQIYFTDVTAQDQGIEIYDMLLRQFSLPDKVKDLDNEIGELYQYGSLKLEDKRKRNSEYLNLIAILFLPATLLTGFLGMNTFECNIGLCDSILIVGVVFILSLIIGLWLNKRSK